MKLKPSAILFDMDGVLVDSLDAWWFSLNEALNQYNYKKISKQDFIDVYWGHDLFDNIEKMDLDYEIGELCNKFYQKNIDKTVVFPDSINTLKKLDNYKKGLITNTPKDSANQILTTYNLKNFFDVVVTSDDVEKAKPNPEIVFKACKKIDVKPDKVVFIGDTKSDMEAAKKSGCTFIGVKLNTKYSIDNINDILNIIQI